MTNNKMSGQKFDLEERTAKFGERIIQFANKISKNAVTIPIVTQMVKAGTSIGANYCEADDAESRKDFQHKIGIAKKEAREVKHWLRMTAIAVPELKEEARELWKEAKELHLIFNAIVHSTKKNKKDRN